MTLYQPVSLASKYLSVSPTSTLPISSESVVFGLVRTLNQPVPVSWITT